MTKPGARLRSVASRVFDAAAMEFVIDPALADLQLECLEAQGRHRPQLAWIYLRAHASFWSAVVAHLVRTWADGPIGERPENTRTRLIFTSVTVTILVMTAVAVVTPFTMTNVSIARLRTAFGGNIARALALLIPSAVPIAIPSGLLFGTIRGLRRRPAARSIRGMILALGIGGMLLSGAMMEWVIPATNQAYRVALFRDGKAARPEPAKGSNELTWGELREQLARLNGVGNSAEARELRLAYQTRLAFILTPVLFAMLAALLAGRPRRREAAIVSSIGLLAYVGYYFIGFNPLVAAGTLSPVTVAWSPNVVTLILIVMFSASSAFSAVESSVHRSA
jgi:hypothetical protein